MDDIPTTLVIVTATAPHCATNATDATAPATINMATTTHNAVGTQIGQPLLGPAEQGVPDWPPTLIIFLLFWVGIAWAVAIVLYFVTFPEKVSCLDRQLEKWIVGRHKHRYVRVKDNWNHRIDDRQAAALNPPVKPMLQR
jgi:hypothetical protein